MGTISKKTIGKAFLIILNTLISILLIYYIFSIVEKKLHESILIDVIFYALIFSTFIGYCLLNNTIIKITSNYYMLVFVSIFSLIILLSLPYLWIYMLFLFPILFFYTLIFYLISPNFKKILLADIITFIIIVGVLLLINYLIKTDIAIYFFLLALSYFGIFHFILALLNRKTLSELQTEK